MVSMFVETLDSLGRQPASKREYEVVEGELSLNVTMGNVHFSFERIDVGDFGFDEVHSPIQHRVAQVEGDVLFFALAKSQSDQGRIKNKIAAARHERNLMLVAQLLRKALSGNHAAKSATQDQYFRHRQGPSSQNRTKPFLRQTYACARPVPLCFVRFSGEETRPALRGISQEG